MTTLYLMRHGETRFNVLHRIQGASDSPLTARGVEQAMQAKAYMIEHDMQFDVAVCSTQERAIDTLELITDLPYQRLKGIKEWDFGVFEGESEALNPKHPDTATYEDFFAEHGYGGERMIAVQARMVATLTDVMKRANGQNVLAVSHGGASYAFLLHCMPWAELRAVMYHGNCAIHVLQFDGNFHFKRSINPLA